jgi:hypothetical protein
MSEADIGRAEHAFSQDGAMRLHQRERSVIADRPDIAEMIGETLELSHERTHPLCAGRRLDAEGCFNGASKG